MRNPGSPKIEIGAPADAGIDQIMVISTTVSAALTQPAISELFPPHLTAPTASSEENFSNGGVAVNVNVGVGVEVGPPTVGVSVVVNVGVRVGEAVSVGVSVAVRVGVGVGAPVDGVNVGVGVGVGVAVKGKPCHPTFLVS